MSFCTSKEATQPNCPKCTGIHSHKSKGDGLHPLGPQVWPFFLHFPSFWPNLPPSHFWPAVASQGGGGEGWGQPTQPRLGTPLEEMEVERPQAPEATA